MYNTSTNTTAAMTVAITSIIILNIINNTVTQIFKEGNMFLKLDHRVINLGFMSQIEIGQDVIRFVRVDNTGGDVKIERSKDSCFDEVLGKLSKLEDMNKK